MTRDVEHPLPAVGGTSELVRGLALAVPLALLFWAGVAGLVV